MRLRIAIVFMLLAVACGGDDKPAPTGEAQSAASTVPDDQQTITVATPGDVYITRDRNLLGMWPDNANICEPLLGIDKDLRTVGILATK